MIRVDVRTAQQQLIDLTEAAARGEDVIITRADGCAVRLVPVLLPTDTPTDGSAARQITIREDAASAASTDRR